MPGPDRPLCPDWIIHPQSPRLLPCSLALPAALGARPAVLALSRGRTSPTGKRETGKLLEECSSLFPICPLGEEVRLSSRHLLTGQSMPELPAQHYRKVLPHLRPATYKLGPIPESNPGPQEVTLTKPRWNPGGVRAVTSGLGAGHFLRNRPAFPAPRSSSNLQSTA